MLTSVLQNRLRTNLLIVTCISASSKFFLRTLTIQIVEYWKEMQIICRFMKGFGWKSGMRKKIPHPMKINTIYWHQFSFFNQSLFIKLRVEVVKKEKKFTKIGKKIHTNLTQPSWKNRRQGKKLRTQSTPDLVE